MIPALHTHGVIQCRHLCADHRWPDSETLPSDDGRLQCDICRATHYDVKPVPHWFRPRESGPT